MNHAAHLATESDPEVTGSCSYISDVSYNLLQYTMTYTLLYYTTICYNTLFRSLPGLYFSGSLGYGLRIPEAPSDKADEDIGLRRLGCRV